MLEIILLRVTATPCACAIGRADNAPGNQCDTLDLALAHLGVQQRPYGVSRLVKFRKPLDRRSLFKFKSKLLVLGSMATWMTGSGKDMDSRMTGILKIFFIVNIFLF